MTVIIRAEEVRIPKHAREAVAKHEPVVVMNRERPVFRIVHPDDAASAIAPIARRGRPMAEVVEMLATAPRPDPGFADDLQAVQALVGSTRDPWGPS